MDGVQILELIHEHTFFSSCCSRQIIKCSATLQACCYTSCGTLMSENYTVCLSRWGTMLLKHELARDMTSDSSSNCCDTINFKSQLDFIHLDFAIDKINKPLQSNFDTPTSTDWTYSCRSPRLA